jgi:membrane peptidoglycan carboxypeptidase
MADRDAVDETTPSGPDDVVDFVPARRPGRRRSRRKILISALVVVLALGIGGAAVVTYFVDSVTLPDQINLASGTTIYYSDGKTVMARVGSTRILVDVADLPPHVTAAVMAAEDPSFLTSAEPGGIAYQYARLASGSDDESTMAKLRRYVMAQKLDDKYTKNDIMGFYLNTVYFGRGAYGIEAAARAYFGPQRTAKSLKLEEAMVLAGVIRSPGDSAYDPAVHPEAAKARWATVRDSLVDMDHLDGATAASMAYPSNVVAFDPSKPLDNVDLRQPTGHVVAQVLSELRQSPPFKDMSWNDIMNGGFTIVTSIDATIQAQLERAAGEQVVGSVMHGQPKYLRAAGVVVQPGTGRVLAYYGGPDGTGSDVAGWHYDSDGQPTGFGAHPAGQTFFAYDLAAALRAGISVKSRWNATSPAKFPDGFTISNIAGQASCKPCTLVQSTTGSLHVPFYGLTYQIGPANVMTMARDAGIDSIWNDKGERVDLRNNDVTDVMNRYYFDSHIGIGQYPVTVVDQANAMATFAADGVRAQAHFVIKVASPQQPKGKYIYAETLPTGGEKPILNAAQLDDLTWTLSQIGPARLAGGPASAGMPGSWEFGRNSSDVGNAWMVGYTRKLAMAVWVGPEGKSRPIRDADGNTIYGSTLPASIYRTVMKAASVGAPGDAFDPPTFVGDSKAGNVP